MKVYRSVLYSMIFIGGGLFGWIIDTASRTYTAGYYAPGTLLPYFSLIFAWAAVMLFAMFRLVAFPFWLSVLVGTLFSITLELVCGFVSLSVFQYRFWDYSDKPFNFYGFIDLRHSIYWLLLTFAYRLSVNRWVKKRLA